MTYAEKLQNSGNFMINESWEIRNINESYSDDDDLMVGGCFALCWLSDKNNNLLRYKPQSIQSSAVENAKSWFAQRTTHGWWLGGPSQFWVVRQSIICSDHGIN